MAGETKESEVPLGTLQPRTTVKEMAAGEKAEEKAETETAAEVAAGWEMAGETKESEVPLGTLQNPAATAEKLPVSRPPPAESEGESRVADAIAQNSAVGVSSAEAKAEETAASKKADKKAEKEAKERAVPGWADNVEKAGEKKESKVPLGSMQHPWEGDEWQESPLA